MVVLAVLAVAAQQTEEPLEAVQPNQGFNGGSNATGI
jgi:hypothetical protein